MENKSNLKRTGDFMRNITMTIKDNIKFYDDTITDEITHDAARKAHIYDHINGLERGFDTVIREHVVMLPVGQRQRIVIARALARSPEILILDEATSALGSESELAIKKTIESIRKTMTLNIIAHRVSTITNANSLLVLKDGAIIEYGNLRRCYLTRDLTLLT